MKKKIISLLTGVVMIIGLIGVIPIVTAGAEASGDYEYSVLSDGTAEITGYTGKDSDLSIPGTLDGKKVTSIGNNAFYERYRLTSVTIPDGVTNIGSKAFYFCDGMTKVTIPNSVTSIGPEAFYKCKKLADITIPSSVTSIGQTAFFLCVSLTNVTIPESVINIGEGAFSDCDSLTSINVDVNNKNYSSINGILFNKDETELLCYPIGKTETSYDIPNSVTSISEMAFYSCENLTSIIIPNNVTSIGRVAFAYCYNLKNITLSSSLTTIGERAFDSCGLTSITIPGSVTSIDQRAFTKCKSLENIIIPSSVTYIGEETFSGCDNLTIKCFKDSAAYKYAEENSINYELLVGYTVTGNVTSFGSDEEAETTITLTAVGITEPLYETRVSGMGAAEYSITNVISGDYTLTVSKQNHVTRTYEITVGDADITQDLKIHLLGDINGDGKISTADVGLANSHAKGVKLLEEYEFLCADVSIDAKISTADVGMINSHAKGVKALW